MNRKYNCQFTRSKNIKAPVKKHIIPSHYEYFKHALDLIITREIVERLGIHFAFFCSCKSNHAPVAWYTMNNYFILTIN